jgi:hypothetical protein
MSDFSLHAPHAEARLPARERVPQFPHVDLIHAAAADQLGITVHVDTRRDGENRPVPPPGFGAAIAAAVQGVVDELMPYPSDLWMRSSLLAVNLAEPVPAVAKSPRRSRSAAKPARKGKKS